MNLRSKEARWAIALIIIGILALLDGLGAINLWGSFWRLWPIVLIVWGVSLLRKRGKCTAHGGRRMFGDTVEISDSPYVKHSSAFGDISIKIRTEDFSGGSASTVFGTISIDLSEVRRIVGYGQLDLHTVFGDISVRVPAGMPVEVRSSGVFGELKAPEGGSFEGKCYRSPGEGGDEGRLVIDCSQVFGDIEVLTT
jgi:predicted membrane protein